MRGSRVQTCDIAPRLTWAGGLVRSRAEELLETPFETAADSRHARRPLLRESRPRDFERLSRHAERRMVSDLKRACANRVQY